MILRFLACGLALPQPTDMRLGKWSRRLGEEKNWTGGITRLSELKDEASLFFCRSDPRRGYGRTAKIASYQAGGFAETRGTAQPRI